MGLTYHPSRKRGEQYDLTDRDGSTYTNVPLSVVQGVLRREGHSVKKIETIVAEARLNAPAAA